MCGNLFFFFFIKYIPKIYCLDTICIWRGKSYNNNNNNNDYGYKGMLEFRANCKSDILPVRFLFQIDSHSNGYYLF